MRVLVTGVTGYIGGRLVPRLLRCGHSVRVLVRDESRIRGRRWLGDVEVVCGDLLTPGTLCNLVDGVDVAYYLVHSMYSGKGFAQRDRQAAENFCEIAGQLQHVVYLGGLQPPSGRVSKHLSSRAESGRILAAHVPTTELRAGPIIGSGSASFEMLRYLTERFPVMVAPSWVLNQVQPIAVRDVLSYLIGALESGPSGVVDIGSETLTYKQMIQGYAEVRGLKRWIVAVPALLPPWIGARWTGLVTPIPNALAVPLVEGMMQPLVGDLHEARRRFPWVEPMAYRKAVKLALTRIRDQAVETRWSSALTDVATYEYRDVRGLIREVRSLHVGATPEAVFRVFTSLGGDRGWLTWNWAWRTRGLIDRLMGGPGLRRGRRDPQELLPGEVVDFWRVEAIDPPHLLRLRGEVRVPGRAWLQWEATEERNGTRLIQTASFVPRGLPGTLYWYMLYPFHRHIFTDMIEAIARCAVAADRRTCQGP